MSMIKEIYKEDVMCVCVCVCVCVYTHTLEYYTAMKNEIVAFAATWMGLEIVLLSKLSQTERGKYQMLSLKCRIFKNCKTEFI